MRRPTFFHDCQSSAGQIGLRQIEVRHGSPAHPGFDQGIDDGAVAIRTIALTAWALLGLVSLAIFRAPTHRQEQIGGIEQASALGRRERPVHLQPCAESGELDGGHGMA